MIPSGRRGPEYNFINGIPTLAVQWDWTIPERKQFERSDPNRRAKGELEDMLDVICKKWLVMTKDREPGTYPAADADWLAKRVVIMDGLKCYPAHVNKVLRNWSNIGYAEIEDGKYARFVTLMPNGFVLGLEEIYRRERRKRKGTTHYQWPD